MNSVILYIVARSYDTDILKFCLEVSRYLDSIHIIVIRDLLNLQFVNIRRFAYYNAGRETEERDTVKRKMNKERAVGPLCVASLSSRCTSRARLERSTAIFFGV